MSSSIARVVFFIGVGALSLACSAARDASSDAGVSHPTPTDSGADGGALPGEWEKGYEPHDVVPGTTTTETSAATPVESGRATKVTLSDGTSVSLPSLTATGTGALTSLTLSRESNDVDLASLGQVTTGSMRVLRFDSFDPVARGLIAANVAPVITIPAKEVGSIDHDTIGVARVADMMDSGQVTKTVTMLPASWDAQGNLLVRDYLFPDSIAADLELADTGVITTTAHTPAPAGYVPRPRHITYVAGTFQSAANWSRSPKLVRMIPQADVPEKRRPFDRVDSTVRAKVEKRCFHTAVVLVHGHNEEEGLGTAPATVDEPWLASYKRDVWTNLYARFTEHSALECMRYYELIYPTYRAIFTPQSGRERLDEAFARLLGAELKPQLDAQMPIQVVIIAHSMGGLVARAGVQLFDQRLQANLRDVITWGTPHTGSPLVTLRYAFAAVPGYEARSGLVSVGLDSVDHTLYAFRRAVENLQVDSPGARDLRWAPSATTTPHDLALDAFFELSPDQVERDQHFDLVNGPWLYNENLKRLNGEDLYRVGGKYYGFYGLTTKRAKLTWKLGKWFRPTIETGGDIAIGATATEWLMKDPTATYAAGTQGGSDGAVPLTSAAGAGVIALGRLAGGTDIDHEEFFGAPSAPGVFTKSELALGVAGDTLWNRSWGQCPLLNFTFEDAIVSEPYRWQFHADLNWPETSDVGRLVRPTDVSLQLLPAGPAIPLHEVAVTTGSYATISAWAKPEDVPSSIWSGTVRGSVGLIDGTFATLDREPSSGCVTPRTLVSLPDGGQRPISQMKRGDTVLAYEPGPSGRPTDAVVERVLRHVGRYKIDRLVADDGSELEITGNHPVLTLEGGYQPVASIAPGDHVFVRDVVTGRFEPRTIAAIVRDVTRENVVYNLKTTRGQYVAEGIVVHNKCLASGSLVDTPSGPRAIETLTPGDRVWTEVNGARVTTTVTHVFRKRTALGALPGRVLTPRVFVTDNHPIAIDGTLRRAGETSLPPVAITGPVYDLATTTGTYLADGVLVGAAD